MPPIPAGARSTRAARVVEGDERLNQRRLGRWVILDPRAPHFIERFAVTTEIEQAMVRCNVFVSGEEVFLGTTGPTGCRVVH